MSDTHYEWYERNGERALFEIGFRDLEAGCDYVLDHQTGQLERIYTTDFYFSEGHEFVRIETKLGKWYEIDGTTTLAKREDSGGDSVARYGNSTSEDWIIQETAAAAGRVPESVADRETAVALSFIRMAG